MAGFLQTGLQCCFCLIATLSLAFAVFIFLLIRDHITYQGVFQHSFPEYGHINIHRDHYGIPHIHAENRYGANYGLGFVNAQDRLWQMTFKRSFFRGEMCQIFGPNALNMDIFWKSLKIKEKAEKILQQLSLDNVQLLQAYVNGINQFAQTRTFDPLQYTLLGVQFEEWKPIDVIQFYYSMSFSMAHNYNTETVRSQLASQYGRQRAEDIFPSHADALFHETVIINEEELQQMGLYSKFTKPTPESAQTDRNTKSQTPLTEQEIDIIMKSVNYDYLSQKYTNQQHQGSNSWVIDGKYTQSGKPFLANDPHLDNDLPSFWYQVELIYQDENIMGAQAPGLPIILSGKTNYFAWGITLLFADTADLFSQKLYDGGDTYMMDGIQFPIKKENFHIWVKGQQTPRIIEVQSTHRGPIITHAYNSLTEAQLEQMEAPVSLAWSVNLSEDLDFDHILTFGSVRSLDDLMKTMHRITAPPIGIVFATTDNHIGFRACGSLPIRKVQYDGCFIQDGSQSKNDWIGVVPGEKNAHVIDPKKGFIVACNNKFADNNYLGHLSVTSFSTARALRAETIIEKKIKIYQDQLVKRGNSRKINDSFKFSINDMMNMQKDDLDTYAELILKGMKRLVMSNIDLAQNKTKVEQLIDILKKWDFRFSIDSLGASVFALWERHFYDFLFRESFNNSQWRSMLIGSSIFDHFSFKSILQWYDSNSTIPFCQRHDCSFCQNKFTRSKVIQDPCVFNLVRSLEDIYDRLEYKFGSDKSTWTWGRINKAVYTHIPFSFTPLKWFFQREYSKAGHKRTLNMAGYNYFSLDFHADAGPNYRMVLDLDNQNGQSYWIIDTGASEKIYSPFFDNQMQLIEKNVYIEMKMGAKHLKDYNMVYKLIPQQGNSRSNSDF